MARKSGRSRGCEPCRRQKMKCDERQPECLQCVRRGRKCPGPLQGLIVFKTDPTNPTKFRRVLETEDPSPISGIQSQLAPSAGPNSDRALISTNPDPFSSMKIPLTHRTNAHFQHFMVHTVKCCWPFQPELLGLWCGKQATSQPAIFYGILSMSASHRFHLDTNSPYGNQWRVQALEFRSKMILDVQTTVNRIEASNAEFAATMIAWLISGEASNANVPEMDIHMAGLQRLIQFAGGFDSLDMSTISFLIGVDILWAAVKCTAPSLPLPSKYLTYALNHPILTIYDSDLSDAEITGSLKHRMSQTLGSRFLDAPWSTHLDRPLKVAIWNFCTLITHYETDRIRPAHERIVSYTDNNPWSVSQRHILTLSYDNLGPTDINEPLRRSMLAYSMARYCSFGAFPCMDLVAGTLREALEPRIAVFYSVAPDLLFWILFVGALTARPISEHYQWYCAGLAGVASGLGLVAWRDARPVLEQFLYVHRLSDRSVDRVWRDVSTQTM
ncbi:hypothetical protein BJY04DRAFT_43236 [Aspergillus karnatakaensis]|uniref:Zn(II)2Cys6 transcription factor n=1 Tax=Aspergillus karnatakaensis TaxID=1810916 RepID=UPI003CCDAE77